MELAEPTFRERALRGLNIHTEPRWADLTGIVRGYDNAGSANSDTSTDGVYRYACIHCGIVVEMSLADIDKAMGRKSGDKRGGVVDDHWTDKGYVGLTELVVRARFKELCDQMKCTHYAERDKMAKVRAVHNTIGVLALLDPVKKNT